MKRLNTFIKTALLFTGIHLLVNYFDFNGLYKDSRRTKRRARRIL